MSTTKLKNQLHIVIFNIYIFLFKSEQGYRQRQEHDTTEMIEANKTVTENAVSVGTGNIV